MSLASRPSGLGHWLLHRRLLHDWLLLLLGGCGSLLLLGGCLRLLLLDVVRVDELLDVQEGHLHISRWLQQLLERLVHADILASLQTLLGDICVHSLGHLRARDHLTLWQLQECTQQGSHLQGLVESIVLAASLALLASGVLNESLDLAQVLADRLQVLGQVIEGDGGRGGGHFYYIYG